MGTHISFLFSIYSENHDVQAEPLNFARSSDITYVIYHMSLGADVLAIVDINFQDVCLSA